MKIHSLYIIMVAALLLPSCVKDGGEEGEEGGSSVPKEWTVSGTVKGEDNTPIAGVIVSDGLSCAITDASGKYEIPVDLSGDLTKTLQYVFVSTPKDWAAPVQDGHAIFWKWLKDYSKNAQGKITGVDFTLTKIAKPERFTIFIFGDPQPRASGTSDFTNNSAFRAEAVCLDMYKDFAEHVDKLKKEEDRPIYAIGLGDIVHRNVKYLPTYRTEMGKTGLVTYNIIGNHDQVNDKGQNPTGMSETEASKAFEKVMGPTNYSFNLGGMHFLMLDNMLIRSGGASDNCAPGLTDDIWTFVQNDLSLVSRDTPIMVCAHAPMGHDKDKNEDVVGNHLNDLRVLLSKYKKAYLWAGHSHSTYNYVDKKNQTIETHTLPRVTGALWTNEYLSENGTPRGYLVFEYKNGDVKWKFKPIYWQTAQHLQTSKMPEYNYRDWDYSDGTDGNEKGRAVMKNGRGLLTDSYQMQLFKPGTYGDGKYVYANIFFWDELWGTPTFSLNGGTAAPMERVTEKNGDLYRYSYADWYISSFYASKWSGLKSEWASSYGDDLIGKKRNCVSIFKLLVNNSEDHGSGKVTVKDRFNQTFTSTITW